MALLTLMGFLKIEGGKVKFLTHTKIVDIGRQKDTKIVYIDFDKLTDEYNCLH